MTTEKLSSSEIPSRGCKDGEHEFPKVAYGQSACLHCDRTPSEIRHDEELIAEGKRLAINEIRSDIDLMGLNVETKKYAQSIRQKVLAEVREIHEEMHQVTRSVRYRCIECNGLRKFVEQIEISEGKKGVKE